MPLLMAVGKPLELKSSTFEDSLVANEPNLAPPFRIAMRKGHWRVPMAYSPSPCQCRLHHLVARALAILDPAVDLRPALDAHALL